MNGRTYRREDLEAARAAWAELKLTADWDEIRRLAAERGMLFPPPGTRWDQWDDPEPTQFALVARAFWDTYSTLIEVIGRSSSWSQAVGRLMSDRDRRRDDADLRDRDDEWRRRDEPQPIEAMQSIAGIVGRIRDSVPQ